MYLVCTLLIPVYRSIFSAGASGGRGRGSCRSRQALHVSAPWGGVSELAKLRNGQSTVGGPKWTKMDQNRPKRTKMDHFGLANAKIQFGIRPFWPKWSFGPFWTIKFPVHFPTVPRPLPISMVGEVKKSLEGVKRLEEKKARGESLLKDWCCMDTQGPFRTKNSTALESVVFCCRRSFPVSVPFSCLFFSKENKHFWALSVAFCY